MLFSFFQNLILSFVREKGGGRGGSVEGQKMAQNDQKLSVSLPISRTVPHMFVVFGTRVKWWYLQQIFSFFKNFENFLITHSPFLNFLLAHFNSFLISSCFSSSSVNLKQKFWSMPYLLHMSVIFSLSRYQTKCSYLDSLWCHEL